MSSDNPYDTTRTEGPQPTLQKSRLRTPRTLTLLIVGVCLLGVASAFLSPVTILRPVRTPTGDPVLRPDGRPLLQHDPLRKEMVDTWQKAGANVRWTGTNEYGYLELQSEPTGSTDTLLTLVRRGIGRKERYHAFQVRGRHSR